MMPRVGTLLCLLLLPVTVWAHDFHPGCLEIRPLASGDYELLWSAPVSTGNLGGALLQLPEQWKTLALPEMISVPDAMAERRVVSIGNAPLAGAVIHFPGLETGAATVYVRVLHADGTATTQFATPAEPWVELEAAPGPWRDGGKFFALGFEHILLGPDHLLFVLGLLLIVRTRVMLLKTITAFTLAHSLTLALATLGIAAIPLGPLNAAIALSILFLGPEIVRSWRGETSLTLEHPWIVAFLFGLLHGFGFASGLSAAGLGGMQILVALLAFNLGVEAGQIAFVGLMLALVCSFHELEMSWPRWIERAPGYAVGILGAFWTIQRCIMMFDGG